MQLRFTFALALVGAAALPCAPVCAQQPSANTVYAAPNGLPGAPSFRPLVGGDFGSQSAHQFLGGPSSGSPAAPGFRALVGTDLPSPGASSLGGVESFTAPSHQWINQISTAGAPSSTQPAFTDISGLIAPAQCPAALAGTLGCVDLNGTSLAVSGGGLSVNLANANSWIALQTFGTGDLAINGGTATAGLATVTSAGVVSSEANATVAQGGTNCGSASGTCLDNITGFSSTGLIDRTGPGTYSFTAPGSGVLAAIANSVNASGGLLSYGIIGTSGATLPTIA